MIELVAFFLDHHPYNLHQLCICKLQNIEGKLFWVYSEYDSWKQMLNREIPKASVFIKREDVCQGQNMRSEFKEGDLDCPLTEELWQSLVKKYL